MATRVVDVDVYDDGGLAATLAARPIRVVYPLHCGDFIELADEPVDKNECLGPTYSRTKRRANVGSPGV